MLRGTGGDECCFLMPSDSLGRSRTGRDLLDLGFFPSPHLPPVPGAATHLPMATGATNTSQFEGFELQN